MNDKVNSDFEKNKAFLRKEEMFFRKLKFLIMQGFMLNPNPPSGTMWYHTI